MDRFQIILDRISCSIHRVCHIHFFSYRFEILSWINAYAMLIFRIDFLTGLRRYEEVQKRAAAARPPPLPLTILVVLDEASAPKKNQRLER